MALAGRGGALPDVSALVGLGPGLTPSGDDFLCGFMATLYGLGYPLVAQQVARIVIPLAATRTNLISAAYLRCAADGEIYEALRQILACVCGRGEDLDTQLDRMEAYGHTSGWDTFAGAVAAYSAICAIGDDAQMQATSAALIKSQRRNLVRDKPNPARDLNLRNACE
jgi:hypothetical protein